jgi:26S proteasome regulatory subunit N11
MDRLLRLGGAGMGGGAAPSDAPVVDTAEQVYISSLALLKMLKHGRAGHYLISTYIMLLVFISVADPLHFGTDPDPGICSSD